MASPRKFQAVVIGASSGGLQALKLILGQLPVDYPLPILIAQHISSESGDGFARLLDELCAIRVKEADEEEQILPGTVYLAPPDYHLLVEKEGKLALSADPPVSYARPSIDVLFESAAEIFGPELIGVILTGANFDGSHGLQTLKLKGGIAIVQDPAEAEARPMPLAALAATAVDYVLRLDQMARQLVQLAESPATPPGNLSDV